MKIEMVFYGMTKDMFPNTILNLDFPQAILVSELKTALLSHVKSSYDLNQAKELIAVSVIATHHEIINPESLITQDQQLSLLPPVSGG